MSELIDKAAKFAIEAHGAQVRKYTGEPYWNHPMRVAEMVASTGADDEVVAAAWLHDVVEDTDYDVIDIWREFGPRIAMMVWALTDAPHQMGNRAFRKLMDANRLRESPPEVQTIKLADLIDNTSSIVEHDPSFAVKYLEEKRMLLRVMSDGDPVLYARAQEMARC